MRTVLSDGTFARTVHRRHVRTSRARVCQLNLGIGTSGHKHAKLPDWVYSHSFEGAGPALPFGVAALLLLAEPRFLRATRRLRGPAPLRHHQGAPNELHQPLLGRLAVLTLAPPSTRHHSQPPLAVESRGELRRHSSPLCVVERLAGAHVPEQLDAGGRGVHVLPPRA